TVVSPTVWSVRSRNAWMHDRSTRARGLVAHSGQTRERAGDLRRAGGRTGYGLFVGGMGPRLIGGYEPCSHPGAGRTHAKHCGEGAAVADPTRRQYRQVKLAEH